MDELTLRLDLAKTDHGETNRLIADYLPFIKSETAKTPVFGLDYDDRLSVAMLVFLNCVQNYDAARGAFLPFVATCIRNRFIDLGKKQQRQQEKLIPLHPEEEPQLEAQAALAAYALAQERESLAEEIERLSANLNRFGIAFASLAEICPKQKRSRALCVRLARETVQDNDLKRILLEQRRLSVAELARRLEISVKTVEKHRRYIVTIAIILAGDYPGIAAFLPITGEVK